MKHLLLVLVLGLAVTVTRVRAAEEETGDKAVLDVDADGTVDLTDAIMVILYLMGVEGTEIRNCMIFSKDATRTDPDEITAYIRSLVIAPPPAGPFTPGPAPPPAGPFTPSPVTPPAPVRDTVVVTETVRDTIVITLLEGSFTPGPAPPPAGPVTPSPAPPPTSPDTPTLSMDIIGFATAWGSPLKKIILRYSNGINDGKTSVTLPNNGIMTVEVFLNGLTESFSSGLSIVEMDTFMGVLGDAWREEGETTRFPPPGDDTLPYGIDGYIGTFHLFPRRNIIGKTFTYMPTAVLRYHSKPSVLVTSTPLTITGVDEVEYPDPSTRNRYLAFPCKATGPDPGLVTYGLDCRE